MSQRAEQAYRDGVEAGKSLADTVAANTAQYAATPDLMQKMEAEWQRLMAAAAQEAAAGIAADDIMHWQRGVMSGAGGRFKELSARVGAAGG